MASDDISRALITFQEREKKPVIAAMAGLAASGGYYVSAPCRWIVANELTLTGSIGVIMQTFNYRGLMDKVGVAPTVFKSGRFKDMLSGSKKPEDVDPAEHKMVQEMVMETFSKFKTVVREGRQKASTANKGSGKTLVSDWEDYADGRVLTGKKAFELGFVDELGNFQTAVERTKQIAGIKGDARIVRYQEPFDLSKVFGMLGKTESRGMKIDVGLDFPRLEAGRLYFLSSSVIE
jgi:protease-4